MLPFCCDSRLPGGACSSLAALYCTQCGASRAGSQSTCSSCDHGFPSPVPDLSETNDTAPRLASGLPPATWGGGQVAAGVVSVALAALAVTGSALLLVGWSNTALTAWLASTLLGVVILPVVWLLGPRRIRGLLPALGLVAPRQHWPKVAALTAGALAGSLGFTAIYAKAVEWLGWSFLSPPDIPKDIVLPGLGAVLTFQALAVWTPFTEELFFRGFVFRGLIRRWGTVGAIAGSALVFSGFHLSPGVLAPVFVTGLLLAWLYHRTGSLWPCVAAHAGQNATALVVTIYTGLDKAQ
ncbi:MAG: CPBP family intramembrane metalloprotease [Dehalococcoidia bacterium]|nr:CPBP family intramembrane metalloprotease [Dehalococcoidia bacterium]